MNGSMVCSWERGLESERDEELLREIGNCQMRERGEGDSCVRILENVLPLFER